MDLQVVLLFVVNIMALLGSLWKGIAVLMTVRDDIRDLSQHVGSRHPPEGMLGEMEALKKETLKHGYRLVELEIEAGVKRQERS